MRQGSGAAFWWPTWVLALVLLALIDAGVTRTGLLWGKTSFEETRDPARVTFAHTYQAARRAYRFEPDGRRPVVLLGNSRLWLAARESWLQPEVARLRPGLRAVNLAIDGAGLGDQEALARHLGRLAPALVVVTVAGADLAAPAGGLPATLLGTGSAEGASPAPGPVARVDRSARTVWPFYRFREFARAALADRIAPAPAAQPFPAHFKSTTEMFDFLYGEQAPAVERAYRFWRDRPTLEAFAAYLAVGRQPYLEAVRDRARQAGAPDPAAPAAGALDALLARLRGAGWPVLVLLMPENPILERDAAGEYRHPGSSDAAAAIIADLATRHDARLVDGRRWMTADAFLDFDHLMPDLSSFQKPFAREITGAAGA